MRTVVKTIVLSLIVTFASAAFAQDSHGQNSHDQNSSEDAMPISPVPMPFDGKDGAETSEQQLEKAKLLLSGYHGLPPKEVFEKTLDQPKVVVMSIALDQDAFTLQRKRALAALSYWKGAGVLRAYIELLQDSQTPAGIRHRLMALIAEHFPAEALGHLKPYLSHKNLQYRLSAIEAIRRLPSEDALSALREALESEKNAVAKKRLEQYTQVAR